MWIKTVTSVPFSITFLSSVLLLPVIFLYSFGIGMLCLIVGIWESSCLSLRNNAFSLLSSTKTIAIIMPSHIVYFFISCKKMFVIILVIIIIIIMGYNKIYFYILCLDFIPLPKIILVGSNLKSKHLYFSGHLTSVYSVFSCHKACKLFGCVWGGVDVFLYSHVLFIHYSFLFSHG